MPRKPASYRIEVKLLSAQPSLSVETITTVSELERVEPEWLDLWRRSGTTPFQSPRWLIPWAIHFTRDNVISLVFRDGARLVGVALFYTWGGNGRHGLFLLGNGISDSLDICVDPEFAAPVRQELMEWLSAQQRFDCIEFNQLGSDTILRELNFQEEAGDPTPVLNLDGKLWEEALPPRQLEKLKYYRRRAAKHGRVEYARADQQNCDELMQTLFQLHGERWNTRGQPGMFDNAELRAFHLEAARRMSKAGILRMYELRIEGTPAASFYGFADSSTLHYYLGGFDPRFEKLSPGMLVIGHAIEQAGNEGLTNVNFLRGRERYKYDWGAVDCQTWKVTT